MRFLREYVIIAVILAIVFGTEYWTTTNLDSTFDWLKSGMSSVKEKISNDEKENAEEEFEILYNDWDSKKNKLAIYVEHNELEKITKNIVIIKSNFETNDMDNVKENIDELNFIVDHIEEKGRVSFKNVF